MEPQPLPKDDRIENLLEGEVKIIEVKRHPFGLIALYFQVIFGIGLGIGLLAFLASSIFTDISAYTGIISIIGILVLSFVAIILLISSYLWHQNKLIISTKNLTQILQKGLFNREVSELSMANVEDVSAEKKGIFQTLLNYGNLKIETAGAISNFHFPYCPRPSYYGKIILDARQRYIDNDPGAASRANKNLHTPNVPSDVSEATPAPAPVSAPTALAVETEPEAPSTAPPDAGQQPLV